jgi:hypothetical protein
VAAFWAPIPLTKTVYSTPNLSKKSRSPVGKTFK